MMLLRVLILLPLLALAGCQSSSPKTPSSAMPALPYGVGTSTDAFYDSSRERYLALNLWYPAAEVVPAAAQSEGIYIHYFGRKNAALLAGKRPLILLSHGTGGTASSLAWVAEYLAGQGYWVVGVDHPKDSWPNATAEGLLEVWQRPRDLSLILDWLAAKPAYAAQIDFERTFVLGHSSGGYTALALAGARYDVRALQSHCQSQSAMPACALADQEAIARIDYRPAGGDYRDPRIKAAIALAPAIGPGLTPASLNAISIPVQLVYSEQDELLADTPKTLAREISTSQAIALPGAGHFVYLSECNQLGKQVASNICSDPEGIDRAAVHRGLAPQILAFLEQQRATH